MIRSDLTGQLSYTYIMRGSDI